MSSQSARVVKGGRLILPAEYRRKLGIRDGDTVIIELDRDELRVRSQMAAVRRLQETVRRYVPQGISLVDELSADRQAEAASESR